MDNQRASILVLTYNNLDYTRQCLESIFAYTEYPDYEVIVVDNASQDGTPAYLTEFAASHSSIKIILNEKNEGFARGNNIAAQASCGNYLVFLNNDTVVTEGWLSRLVAHVQNPLVGIVGPVTNSSANETLVEVDYQGLEGMEQFAAQYSAAHAGEVFEIGMVPFMCAIMRREVYEDVGPLDERFGMGMFEDDDYAMRLRQKGYKILCTEDVFIHHWGSASFSKIGDDRYRQLFEENRLKFQEKWNREWQPHLYRDSVLRKQMIVCMAEREQWYRRTQEYLDQLVITQQKADSLQACLNDIYHSRSWRLMKKFQSFRLILVPRYSQRERLLAAAVHNFQRILPAADHHPTEGKS